MVDTANLTEGTELETDAGEPVEITNERPDGCLCLYFPERERDGAFTEWRHPDALAGAISDGVFTVVSEDTEGGDDPDGHMDGEFHGPIRCPECGSFMSTGYDGEGFPVARCSSEGCPGWKDVNELLEDGQWTQGGSDE